MILGGVRSGKSRFAQDLAESVGGEDVLFVATAEAGDGEMSERIRRHRQSRPAAWKTLECPLNVGEAIARVQEPPSVVLVDCLTLLVSNVLFQDFGTFTASSCEQRVAKEIDGLLRAARQCSSNLLIVSGEVGCGIVPESAMGREFRDVLGFANQRLALSSVATYYMVAGLAVEASRLATSVADASRSYSVAAGKQA